MRKRLKDNKAEGGRPLQDSTNVEHNEGLKKKHKAIAVDNDDGCDGQSRDDTGTNQDRYYKSDEFDESEKDGSDEFNGSETAGSDDQTSDSDDQKEEVIVDDDYAPQSQEWMISF